jgi:hypothetical protein
MEQTRNTTKKQTILACITIHPILQGKTTPAPLRLMGSTDVQQSLSHTTDSQLD